MRPKARPIVTDHAVLRCLERVCGLDTEAIRNRIHQKVHHALSSGATCVTLDGYRYRIHGGRVVTITGTPVEKRRRLDWKQGGKNE